MRDAFFRLSVLALALAGAAAPARAAPIEGTWLTESGETKVRVAPCGSRLCGTIVWLRKPGNDVKNPDPEKRGRPLVGSRILDDLAPGANGRWDGQLYNYTSGKTYSGSATPDGENRMKLSGCVLGGLICRSQIWVRVE